MFFIDPLEPEAWFRAMGALSERARRSAADLEEQLRHSYHLLQMTPLPIREIIDPPCDEIDFERFLACGAYETAALSLIPAPLKYSAARGEGPMVVATVALPGDDVGTFASSESIGSALLQAWAQSMASLEPGAEAHSRKASAQINPASARSGAVASHKSTGR